MDGPGAQKELARVATLPDERIDLAGAALLIAATEYPDLDMGQELGALDSLAAGAARGLDDDRDPLHCVNAISRWLFDDLGFKGNDEDYYDPNNSYLNEVLSRRIGIPITLSLVYIEVGKRLGVPLVGIGMPGHFIVGHRDVKDVYIDPFQGGILLSLQECIERFRGVAGSRAAWDPKYLEPIGNRDFVARMLRNLKAVYFQREDYARAVTVLDMLVTLQPQLPEERRDRGLAHYRLGNHAHALDDLRAFSSARQDAPDERIERLLSQLMRLQGD